MKKGMLVTVGSVLLIFLVSGGSCVSKYNQIAGLKNQIDMNWVKVEDVLQRRNELIPNLSETVKGYAFQERQTFDNLARARAEYAGATNVSEMVEANKAVEREIEKLLAIVDIYPQLKADQRYVRLRDELSGMVDRIAVERHRYNESVHAYNAFLEQFLNNSVAGIFGFEPEDSYFEAVPVETEVQKVDISGEGDN
jgi:LemA protein